MLFGIFFTNIGKRFDFNNYGSLAGLGLLVSAIASLLQYPMIVMASRGDDKIVNAASAIAMANTGLPYCWWLWYREHYQNNETIKE